MLQAIMLPRLWQDISAAAACKGNNGQREDRKMREYSARGELQCLSRSPSLCSSSQCYTWLPWKHTCSTWVVRPVSWDTTSGKQTCSLNLNMLGTCQRLSNCVDISQRSWVPERWEAQGWNWDSSCDSFKLFSGARFDVLYQWHVNKRYSLSRVPRY